MAQVKCIPGILDGLGDRPHEILAGQRPLQPAYTLHLGRLAAIGMNGLHHHYVQRIPRSNSDDREMPTWPRSLEDPEHTEVVGER